VGEALKKGKTVLASGVFDLIHPGHIAFLRRAKEVGGPDAKLIVIVARDSTAEKFKGKRPVLPEEQRRYLVENLKPVDLAVLGNEAFDPEAFLEKFKPDIVAVGYDQQQVEAEVRRIIEEKGLPVQVVRIEKFGPEGFNSSSKIKKLIAKIDGGQP